MFSTLTRAALWPATLLVLGVLGAATYLTSQGEVSADVWSSIATLILTAVVGVTATHVASNAVAAAVGVTPTAAPSSAASTAATVTPTPPANQPVAETVAA